MIKFTFTFVSFFIFQLLSAQSKDNGLMHIEPPNWWTNMEHSAVEIMLHGKSIGNCTVKVDGLTILGVVKTENPNYIFVTIDTKHIKAGTYNFTLSEGKKVKHTFSYEIQERDPNSKFRMGFATSDVIYLLMPDRFANGNPNNDSHLSTVEKVNRNLPGGRHGGDLAGISNQLDYIKNLGATAIWSTPILEDNDTNYSYHTYGQSDLYKVDPRYGTNEEYKKLVETAHSKGLKIIQDVVPNHWGSNHWMFFDLPTYTWIHQFPGYAQTNYRMSTQMDNYTSRIDKELCADGWFVRSMPDLNQNNPLVLNYLIQNTIWWMEYANLDGLRVDTYSYNDKEGIATWTKKIMEEYPNTNIVGEVWMHDQAHQSYWQKNSPIAAIHSYNTHLPTVMDFTFHDATGAAFGEKEQHWDQGMMRFYDNLVNDFLYADPMNLLVFFENHDTQRFNQNYSNIADYKLVMTLLATMRGIPQIYYGSEIGMQGDKGKGDADIRRDFPGGWKEDPKNAFTKAGRTEEQESYHAFTSLVLNWRKTSKAIHEGKTIQFIPQNNVYVYFRTLPTETVMVIVNNSPNSQEISTNRFAEILVGFSTGNDVISGKTIDLKTEKLAVEGKTSYILTLNKN